MSFEFRHQPLKTLFYLYAGLSILCIRLPVWILTSLVSSWRPRSSWPISRAVIVPGLRAFVGVIYKAGYDFMLVDPDKNAKSASKLGFVWIEPVSSDLLRGQVADTAKLNDVVPAKVSGYWYGKRSDRGAVGQRASEGERVFFALHGGAYIMDTAAPSGSSSPILKGLLDHSAGDIERAFSLDYRLSSAPPYKAANAWPAALLDALAGYNYLIHTVGFQPQNIILVGDSAGGHLALALTYYLASEKLASLPLPKAVLLLSPSVDWACTHVGPQSSMETNARSDFVGEILNSGYTARALLGRLPESDVHSIWISPASLKLDTAGAFSQFPPTYILAGGAEQTVDAMRTLRDRLLADNRDDAARITYMEYPDAIHDFLTAEWHEPERTEGLKDIKAWLAKLSW